MQSISNALKTRLPIADPPRDLWERISARLDEVDGLRSLPVRMRRVAVSWSAVAVLMIAVGWAAVSYAH
ncbi:MAG: hypothetical protein WCL39_00950, partial [Armatimonadota bacterium]